MRGALTARSVVLILYIFLGLTLVTEILRSTYTASTALALFGLYIAGLVMLLGYHYILPSIFKSYRIGSCVVRDKKYIICERMGSPDKVGYLYMKVIPDQPIADMDKDRREAFLQSVAGLLAGTNFEAMVAFVTVRDAYGENIKERLKAKRSRLLSLMSMSRSASPAQRARLERIERELHLLDRVPVILEGFFLAVIRDRAPDEPTLISKLEADANALASRLAGIGVKTKVVWGEELRLVLDFCQFGNIVQVTWG